MQLDSRFFRIKLIMNIKSNIFKKPPENYIHVNLDIEGKIAINATIH